LIGFAALSPFYGVQGGIEGIDVTTQTSPVSTKANRSRLAAAKLPGRSSRLPTMPATGAVIRARVRSSPTIDLGLCSNQPAVLGEYEPDGAFMVDRPLEDPSLLSLLPE
jgi:hypothetical protein